MSLNNFLITYYLLSQQRFEPIKTPNNVGLGIFCVSQSIVSPPTLQSGIERSMALFPVRRRQASVLFPVRTVYDYAAAFESRRGRHMVRVAELVVVHVLGFILTGPNLDAESIHAACTKQIAVNGP